MIIDGEGDRIDKKAPDIFFDSPENVIVDMPVDAIEQLFASQAAERKASVLEFTPDEIRITAENKFDDGIYELLYEVWKETSGEYNPKDDKPIVDPRGNVHTQNETKFKYWAMEQYGMTSEEYRGYTFKGTGKTILETAGAYFKVTAPIDAKNGITYLTKKGVTPKNMLKAAFGMTDDVAKKEVIEEVAKGTAKGIKEGSRVTFRQNADPFREIMGAGIDSHPKEWNALLNKMKDNGVEIVYREGVMAYSPAKGVAGQIIIDPNASYSALLHEYTHYLDDAVAGFPGMEYHFQTINKVKMELHAYMQEIKLAESLPLLDEKYKDISEQLAKQLFENYRKERALLTSHLK